ncbi:hypothetical protein [Cryobacterium sp. M25]|uniref:hypothetical protein n=1 Tax=Cryobacterium sp. M25 TaxID=2048293 RepID=UPI000CE44C09|nr:hypothetical protein [Cryobacterium sp. M25]
MGIDYPFNMGSKPSAESSAHLHKDLDISPAKVRAFGDATYRTQLQVLAELRIRSGDDTTSIEYAVAGLLLGFSALIFAPAKAVSLEGLPWWVSLVGGALLALLFVAVLFPFLIPQALRHHRRRQAIAWLAAYEDEISRRRSMGGREGRVWRMGH